MEVQEEPVDLEIVVVMYCGGWRRLMVILMAVTTYLKLFPISENKNHLALLSSTTQTHSTTSIYQQTTSILTFACPERFNQKMEVHLGLIPSHKHFRTITLYHILPLLQ